MWQKNQKNPNSRWRTDAILKIIFGYNSAPYGPIKTKFGMRRQNHRRTVVSWWKCQIPKIQHGGRPPFWKSLHLYISAANCPNFMKLSTQTYKFYPRRRKRDKQNQKFSNSRWRTNAILKIIFLLITRLHRVRLILNLQFGGIIARTRRLGDQNVQFRRSNMAYGRHFEKSSYIYISAANRPNFDTAEETCKHKSEWYGMVY